MFHIADSEQKPGASAPPLLLLWVRGGRKLIEPPQQVCRFVPACFSFRKEWNEAPSIMVNNRKYIPEKIDAKQKWWEPPNFYQHSFSRHFPPFFFHFSFFALMGEPCSGVIKFQTQKDGVWPMVNFGVFFFNNHKMTQKAPRRAFWLFFILNFGFFMLPKILPHKWEHYYQIQWIFKLALNFPEIKFSWA